MSETPQPDARSDDGQQSSQPQIVVDDPEDFAATRQLRAIYDARDDYIQARRDANDAHDKGDMSFSKMNGYIFRYVQDFAMAAEPLLRSYDDGKELWEQQEYGIDSNFVDHRELASFDDGLQLFHKLAKKIVAEGLTEQRVQFLADSFNVDLSPGELGRVFDTIENAQKQQQQQQTTSKVNLPAQTLDDISEMDPDRLRAAVQRANQPDVTNPTADASDVVQAIRKVKGDGGWTMSHRSDKCRNKLRIQATDWGWQTTGTQSLIRHAPKLAYVKTHGPEFGTTAPPQQLSNDVFRDIQLFLDDIGLGITFDEEQQTKIDDDLLKEVNDWREENL